MVAEALLTVAVATVMPAMLTMRTSAFWPAASGMLTVRMPLPELRTQNSSASGRLSLMPSGTWT